MNGALPVDDGRCFVCGPYNAEGLHLHFAPAADGVRAEVMLPPRLQGWRGTAHGGVVAMLLDEAMAYACLAQGERGMTASMQMRFRAAVPLGEPVVVTGTMLWRRRNVLACEASVADAAGTVLASAEGSFVSRGPIEKDRLGARLA